MKISVFLENEKDWYKPHDFMKGYTEPSEVECIYA